MELAIHEIEERRREDKEFACATRDLLYQDLYRIIGEARTSDLFAGTARDPLPPPVANGGQAKENAR